MTYNLGCAELNILLHDHTRSAVCAELNFLFLFGFCRRASFAVPEQLRILPRQFRHFAPQGVPEIRMSVCGNDKDRTEQRMSVQVLFFFLERKKLLSNF